MQVQCHQVVLTPIVDEEFSDRESQLAICKSLYAKNKIFSGTINRNGSTIKHDQLKITAITGEELIDIISFGGGHSLSIKNLPIRSLVSIIITSNNPVDIDSSRNLSIKDFLDL